MAKYIITFFVACVIFAAGVYIGTDREMTQSSIKESDLNTIISQLQNRLKDAADTAQIVMSACHGK